MVIAVLDSRCFEWLGGTCAFAMQEMKILKKSWIFNLGLGYKVAVVSV